MKITSVKIKDLKPAEYNPRKWSKSAVENLTRSIRKFGIVDPIIANCRKGREGVIIGGHFRIRIAKNLGIKEVPVFFIDLDKKGEKELNLRLNRNTGDWDWDLLKDFDKDFLKDVGFSGEELKLNFDLPDVDGKEFDDGIETDNKCPKCGYEW